MRMYELSIDMLAEDHQHAEQIMARITQAVSTEQMVLSVGGLEDVTHHATQDDELTDEETEGFLRQRNIWFINRLRRLQTRV